MHIYIDFTLYTLIIYINNSSCCCCNGRPVVFTVILCLCYGTGTAYSVYIISVLAMSSPLLHYDHDLAFLAYKVCHYTTIFAASTIVSFSGPGTFIQIIVPSTSKLLPYWPLAIYQEAWTGILYKENDSITKVTWYLHERKKES